ncbi:hypothetical protein ACS0TY_031220 [Phlomoides rotata]
MADAAVEFLLENLKQLLLHHAHLIKDAKKQVVELENDLRLFKGFLKDSTKQRNKDEKLREVVRQIRDVVYEAEDIIDASVTQAAEVKSKGYFHKAFRTPTKLLNIAEKVDSVRQKINSIYGDKTRLDFANLRLEQGEPEQNEVPEVKEVNVVGFEDESKKLIGYLMEETQQLDVISIIGMPGLGKTTLAGKIFRDPAILYEFPTRIWVYVSQEFTKRDIFLTILKELTTRLTDDIKSKSDQELAKLVATHLETAKFLLIMDDVWTPEDWDKLRNAFPKSNKRGKVMITSRQLEVGRHVNHCRDPHMLRFLNLEESWELLRWEVFGKLEFPSDLEAEGTLIAERCGGLPLAIVVIGGILVKKFSALGDISVMRKSWRKVSEKFTTYLHDDRERRMEKIISLSYEKLPYYLRECFLYVGLFPEDFEIPAWKLIRMWIAEGLIQQKDGISLEETAEITEAGIDREGFFQEFKKSDDGGFQPPIPQEIKYRRLCIHSNVSDFLSARPAPYGPNVRSFVCFSRDQIPSQTDNISSISAGFKLLRVLDVKPIKCTRLPSNMYHLLHLRYIAVSLDSNVLPTAFSKLWNIQTLIVDTSSRVLEIRADILNMMQLRHFKTNASATLPKTGKSSKGGERIQTLGTISPESCTKEVFDRARNLKKLGVRGRLALLLEDKDASFDNFEKLDNLEKLKLINDVFPISNSEGHLRRLPPAYTFPAKLRSLTLSETCLDWSHMSILGSLEKLEVLKLKDKAFMGETWKATDGGFRQLEVLYIGRTNLTIWLAAHHHFPRIKHLELDNCENLQRIPIGLADIPSFQKLDLYRCKYAAASAKKINDAKIKQREQSPTTLAFKLSIFPPGE